MGIMRIWSLGENAGVEGESRIIVIRAAHMRAGLLHLLHRLLRCLPFNHRFSATPALTQRPPLMKEMWYAEVWKLNSCHECSYLQSFGLDFKKRKRKKEKTKRLNISHGFSHELPLYEVLGNFCTYLSGGNDQHLYSISGLKTWLILLCITGSVWRVETDENDPLALTNCFFFHLNVLFLLMCSAKNQKSAESCLS